MVKVTAYLCSAEADSLWSRLLGIYALVNADEDPCVHGLDYSKRALARSNSVSDLWQESHSRYVQAESTFMLLAGRGGDRYTAARLAQGRLKNGKSIGRLREQLGVSWCGERWARYCRGCTTHPLEECAKEYLRWSLGDDDGEPEPELPWR